jgi:pimeloyl-ACP methyl ester carboxylesterase
MNPAAWTAWLQSGSKEDWASYVGVLELPTLIVAGTQDGSLGPDAQRTHTLPHFSRARLAEVNCSHLIPLERPGELASLISTFLEDLDAEVRL